MTVALLPPVTGTPGMFLVGAEALLEGPRFVRSRAMTRWHRPRTGVRYGDGRVVYSFWCTGHVGGGFLSCDIPPAGDLVCGMCDGKSVGAGQETNGPVGRELIFSPRDIDPPTNCPASRSDRLYEELPGGRAGRCLACQDVHPLRAMGGPYNPRYAIVQHPTGPGIVEPCPFHRWRQLTVRGDRVVCACGRETKP